MPPPWHYTDGINRDSRATGQREKWVWGAGDIVNWRAKVHVSLLVLIKNSVLTGLDFWEVAELNDWTRVLSINYLCWVPESGPARIRHGTRCNVARKLTGCGWTMRQTVKLLCLSVDLDLDHYSMSLTNWRFGQWKVVQRLVIWIKYIFVVNGSRYSLI